MVETSDGGMGTGYTGLRVRGSDPTRINVTINGVPLNDAESQGVFWVNLPDLAASAEEIQLQRGVGSSTNGAGAFGATLNVDISKIHIRPFAQLTAGAGSFGVQRYSGYFGSGLINNRWSFSGRLSNIRSDGYIDRASANLNSLHLNAAYLDERQSWQMHLLSGHEITYQAWNGVPVQYIHDDRLSTFNTAGTEQPGEPYDNEVDDYTQRHWLMHYKREISDALWLQLNGHYTRGFGFYEQYKASEHFSDYGLPTLAIGDTVIDQTDLIRRRWLDNHFGGGTFALRWRASSACEWLLGGGANLYQGKHFGELIWAQYAALFPKDYRYYDNDAEKTDMNVFLKSEYRFAPQWTSFWDAQVRRVQYRFLGFDNELRNVSQDDGLIFFNPKVGLSWNFQPRSSAYVFAGVGHREPNRDDYTQSTPASRPRPEQMLDLEGGLKTGQSDWRFQANVFWMQYRDQLVLDGRINDVGAYTRINVPESYRAGLELEAFWKISQRWQVAGNTTLSQNKVKSFTEYRDNWDTGEQEQITYQHTDLAFSPRWMAQGNVQFAAIQNSRHNLNLTFSGKYVGQQYLDNTQNDFSSLKSWLVHDLRLNYDLKYADSQRMSLIFAVNNLFNQRYSSNGWVYRYESAGYDARPDDPYTQSEGGSTYAQVGLFPQAGRHWMATLRIMLGE